MSDFAHRDNSIDTPSIATNEFTTGWQIAFLTGLAANGHQSSNWHLAGFGIWNKAGGKIQGVCHSGLALKIIALPSNSLQLKPGKPTTKAQPQPQQPPRGSHSYSNATPNTNVLVPKVIALPSNSLQLKLGKTKTKAEVKAKAKQGQSQSRSQRHSHSKATPMPTPMPKPMVYPWVSRVYPLLTVPVSICIL